MAQFTVHGIQVLFPYEPYKVQEEYMKKVIECLQRGVNGILESPTGTGKTLSLLCSSLAWLENRKAQQQLLVIQRSASQDSGILSSLKSALDGIAGGWTSGPNLSFQQIIYSSRTHSQLSQAIQELKRSNYKHMKSVVLGSREQLCLHPEVLKASSHTAKVYMCRAKVKSRTCSFYLNYEEKMLSQSDYQNTSVMDIEDLVTLGKKHVCCPYYAARSIKAKADIIFTPYNYIIDPKSRRAHGIELIQNVLIFDEAHNIESACEESMSFQLRSYDLALCINEIDQTLKMMEDVEHKDFSSSDSGAPEFTLKELAILKVIFCELEKLLDEAVAECSINNGAKPGDYVIEMLSKVELTPSRVELVLNVIDKVILYHSSNVNSVWSSKGAGLQKFSDLLNILFSRTGAEGFKEVNFRKEFSTKYKVFLQYEAPNKGQSNTDPWAVTPAGSKKKQSWKLDCWCFSPGLGMQDIVNQGVHSIILTSGTLSPLGPMVYELGVNFPVQLENPHIIKDDQVFVAIIPCGPDGTPLNSSYQNRTNEAYICSLGRGISNFARVTPDGVLVFFPSYSVMKSNIGSWEENGIWRSLSGIKPIFTEPQGKDAFQESIEKFYSTIQDPSSKGATLLAVCRGKVSEGLDFADRNARAVVITGLPYPPAMDPRVKLKMDYLNTMVRENKQGLHGREWYTLQATRAVNQAIGRVIRHKDDYGAILLCDNRFKDKHIQSQLSKWIQGRINIFNSFGPVMKHLTTFFKALDSRPVKEKLCSSSLGAFQMSTSSFIPNNLNGALGNNMPEPVCIQEERGSNQAENLFESYKLKNDAGSSSNFPKQSNSIFDALEDQVQYVPPPAARPSSMNHCVNSHFAVKSDHGPSSNSEIPKVSKKRKIAITYREADQPLKDKAKMWKEYLITVKTALGATLFEAFRSSIKEFKDSKDVEKLAMSMISIFTGVSDREKYLQSAALLIGNPDHRAIFLAMCL